ncbi:UDP-2-acetamido-2,6-beta-L-arabino-hexul-4-ose reductase [Bradyrhizobium centrosematis]|uniref:UDP-2-acetamido-2,6-beta-L-arabino-hexul-4-ose reductase n=1 Tax=Bradyrhizobium centrosematis TaxID=1300039 RepID=UPI0021694AA2|nr:NAD-dependent epimerase/dehydratase family protein [Bradyrhizobium centrosematis]MCS3765332.1 UDP-2-acetamido-2,6-beta-L-arabino-hexul-4-ose reductase [Bradyrhizobium centrosematis]MCS3773968.1 UDP-2-acetamido-2,6-beta-L-arabino-hexul-4-ose reductase [Bradyrhizobium centrosematis]
MRILITGADGFIGANLRARLRESGAHEVISITRATNSEELNDSLAVAEIVYHLAGVNRPSIEDEFLTGNYGFTQRICDTLQRARRRIPVVFASSTQATHDNPYGRSKLAAEDAVRRYGEQTDARVFIFRLTNVFGKWARPNYNSVVATFCHNMARGLPIVVSDPSARLRLLHIDAVSDALIRCLNAQHSEAGFCEAGPIYETTVGEVADIIRSFQESRSTLLTPHVGAGLVRVLYATFVSYLPPAEFAYTVPLYEDARGTFAEILKTPDCGQFSYFTARPGVTRGEHYHHTKTEKFVVLKGTAQFGFRHIETGEIREVIVRGGHGQIVETIPGWAHNITNVGAEELIVMLWANEIFDRSHPDTIPAKVVIQ